MLKLTIFLLAVGLSVGLKNDPECDIKLAARNCIKTGFLVGDNKAFPKNDDEMAQMCTNVQLGEECSKKFMDKCAENDKEKKILDTALDGAIRVMKRVCKTDTKKADFLKNIKDCGNAILSESREKCTKQYKKHLLTAAEMDDKEQIMKVMCCKVKDIAPCIKGVMDGKSECNEDNKKYVETVRKSIADELTSVVCVDFEKDAATKCAGLEVPEFRGDVDKESLLAAIKKIMDKTQK